jgi:hypothetical protein
MNGVGCFNGSRSAVLKSSRWKGAPELHDLKRLTPLNLETVLASSATLQIERPRPNGWASGARAASGLWLGSAACGERRLHALVGRRQL